MLNCNSLKRLYFFSFFFIGVIIRMLYLEKTKNNKKFTSFVSESFDLISAQITIYLNIALKIGIFIKKKIRKRKSKDKKGVT